MEEPTGHEKSPAAPKTAENGEMLRQSEERFRLMVEAVKDYGIFLLDPEGHIVSWNEGAERIKGYTAAEIIGQHLSVFYPPDALARDWPAYELGVAKRDGRFEDEGWRVRKDGSRFWANVVITALWSSTGEMIGFTKVTRDLSERRRHEAALKRSERRLERANVELTEKNRELQDFAHVASHDLQEPLRKIRTFAELLEEEYRDAVDAQGRMYIDRIRVSTQRMSALINVLLSYSRVSTRGQPFQAIDLNLIVREVIGDLQVLIDETEGRVDLAALPVLEADPTQMRQLFQNIIGNALKFRRPGVPPVVRVTGGAPPAEMRAKAREVCTIVVEDNGIGFDEKYADQIFDPFQRLHTRREYEGTGLGLAICKRIVERHDGHIAARSRPGQGTTFTICLPVRSAPSSEDTVDEPVGGFAASRAHLTA